MRKGRWAEYARIRLVVPERVLAKPVPRFEFEWIRKRTLRIREPAMYWVWLDDYPIPRALREDPNGTLSIGKTKSLDARFRQYCSGMTRGRGHSSANRMYYLAWKSPAARPLLRQEIVFSYKRLPFAALEAAEQKYLHDYVLRYGEPPMLNAALPNR